MSISPALVRHAEYRVGVPIHNVYWTERGFTTSMLHTVGIASLISGLAAQMLKVIIGLFRDGRLRVDRVFDTGGMPSSHTSTVTTLTIGAAIYGGISSALFSIVLIFSMYIVFEAAGLRQEVGKQAKVLNELIDDMLETHHLNTSRLKELVGHTWGEVTVGFLVGVIVALVAYR
jgi:acid phosphatase family membrane protein YuiD